ncbi:alkaline phosphatase family protein [Pseudodesulfovibrio sp.]|uniref:alkaline phosphatase family protein n=1 Tax=unclassified Pseudodesulfovibrio TaxID=2661612 RepID=UPI003B007D09
MPKKCVLILFDGLGDRALPELDYKTPLQAAQTPTLDRLAAMGSTGLYHANKIGRPLPSETAHFALYGCPPEEFPGRGALEALGAGISLNEGDVAMLAHFASVLTTLDGQMVLRYDRMCGTPEETDALFEAVQGFEREGIRIDLHRTNGMFGVLTLRGDVSPYVTDSNPMVDGRMISAITPFQSHSNDASAARTARVLTAFLRKAHAALNKIEINQIRAKQKLPPINGLVTQRAGRLCPVTSLPERYGMRCLSLASSIMYRGMARFLGMDFQMTRNSRDPGRDLAERIETAVQALNTYDFIHIHTKAPDHAAHSKRARAKLRAIESLDQGLSQVVDQLLRDDVLLVITSDHSTPSTGALIHSGEPVPLLFVGTDVRRDMVTEYNEISVGCGCLGTMRGDEMMHMILNYTDRARLAGIHDSPVSRDYWPGDYFPFTLFDPESD